MSILDIHTLVHTDVHDHVLLIFSLYRAQYGQAQGPGLDKAAPRLPFRKSPQQHCQEDGRGQWEFGDLDPKDLAPNEADGLFRVWEFHPDIAFYIYLRSLAKRALASS